MNKTKLACVILLLGFIFGFSLWGILKADTELSQAERRKLTARPTLSAETIWSGKFMSAYEDYVTDQFPIRDELRSVKAFTAFKLLRQRDVNGIFIADGSASRLEYPIDEASIKNAQKKFRYLYDKYLKESGGMIYFSLIPDKNRFIAEKNGAPAIDYDSFAALMREDTDEYMQYIDIFDTLCAEDYYRTDTHWRQERIGDTAQRLADAMGIDIEDSYEAKSMEKPFYGVYCGQSALPLTPDTMTWLDSATLQGCRVYDYESGEYIGVYDFEKAEGMDMYELFLSGSKSLLRIENPTAQNDRRLIIFRDSFGSSIAPLLVPGYAEITLVDIRYLASPLLGNMLSFDGADVLFLYSVQVLNNSITLK